MNLYFIRTKAKFKVADKNGGWQRVLFIVNFIKSEALRLRIYYQFVSCDIKAAAATENDKVSHYQSAKVTM